MATVFDIESLEDGTSTLMRAILHQFFSKDSHNFLKRGIKLRHGDLQPHHIKARLAAFVADEKAHKETFCLKSAGGVKFCFCCASITRNRRDVPGSNIRNIQHAYPEHFILHSHASFKEVRPCPLKPFFAFAGALASAWLTFV